MERSLKKKRIITLSVIMIMLLIVLISGLSGSKEQAFADVNPVRTLSTTRRLYSEEEIKNMDYYCLKDDNIIFTPNQGPLGVCWDFATLKSIETSLSLATNEVYDLSEAWISLMYAYDYSNYTIGDGGSDTMVRTIIQKYGIVLERDCPFEMLSQIDGSSKEELKKYVDYYSQFANKDIIKVLNYKYEQDSYVFDNKTSQDFIMNVKRDVINNGSCYLVFNANSQYKVENNQNNIATYYSSSFVGINHAVSVIGWDDNITLKTDSSIKGAYIVQNSWGNAQDEGYIYISYYDKNIYEASYFSVDTTQLQSFTAVTKTNSNLKNWYSNIANSNEAEQYVQEKSLNQGNVFYTGDSLDLTYTFLNNSINYNNVKISIYDGDDETDDLKVTRNYQNVHITRDLLETPTCYKVKFHYDENGNNIIDDGEEVYYKQIFVTDGVIFDGIRNAKLTGYQSQSVDFTDLWIINEYSSYVYIGSYSKIESVEVNSSSSLVFTRLQTNAYATATDSSYSTGILYFIYDNSSMMKNKWYENQIIFTTTSGTTKTITVHYKKVDSGSGNNDILKEIVYFNYLTDYKNVATLPKIEYKYSSITLPEFNDKGFYMFDGWYKDSTCTTKLSNKLSMNDYTFLTSKRNYFAGSLDFNYIILYPNYVYKYELELQDTVLNEGVYNTNYSETVNVVISGCGNYSYQIISGSLPQGLSFNNCEISGTPLSVGSFSITLQVTDLLTNETETCLVSLTIKKMQLVYNITPCSSDVGQSLGSVTLSIVSGNINSKDGEVASVDLSKVDKNNAGIYSVSIINLKPEYYDISLNNPQDAYYQVTSSKIYANISGYNGAYDGRNHTISVNVTNLSSSQYSIQYSLDNINYTSSLVFKNATNGEVIVYVKVTSKDNNYDTLYATTKVNISKAILTASLKNNSLEYNFKEQIPEVIISGAVNNDNLTYDVSGASKKVGNHTVTITLKGDTLNNYSLNNSTLGYKITKIKPTYILPNFKLEDIARLNKVYELDLPTVEDGFSIEILNPDDDLIEGENVVKFKITPLNENAEIYDSITSEYTVVKEKVTIKTDITFIIILGVIIVAVIVVTIIVVVNNKKKQKNLVKIVFVTNSTLSLNSIQGSKNEKQTLPIPIKPGSEFVGWYVDKNLKKPYSNNGNNEILTLYAKWNEKNKRDIYRPDISQFQRYKS